HFETDEIKYLFFASISYSQMACTKISALDFINKIRTHSLFSFQRSNFISNQLVASSTLISYHIPTNFASFFSKVSFETFAHNLVFLGRN
ncbi:hypothetical protein ACVWZB_004448, partial [Paenibacillus polymyxa]